MDSRSQGLEPFLPPLSSAESEDLRAELLTKWGVDEAFYPTKPIDRHFRLIAFHTGYFDAEKQELLRRLLAEKGVRRVWELREGRESGYELDLTLFDPFYNGLEGYWTVPGGDWLVYASHESSITLAGDWLVARFAEIAVECRQHQYGGPFSTDDLRGKWR